MEELVNIDCAIYRESLLTKYPKNLYALSLAFFSEKFGHPKNRDELAIIAKHMSGCKACQSWIKDLIPKRMYKRQSRLAKYCCSELFECVEESIGEGVVHIHPTWFRGEVVWIFEQSNSDATISILTYCPWCGNKLPYKPFVPDRKGFGLKSIL